jgi:hypothetical protein
MYERNESLRIESIEGRNRGGDPNCIFRETGVKRYSTSEDYHMGK